MVVPFQTTVAGAELLRGKAQKPERVFRIAGPDHWQAPHHGQGCDRALERMWMDVRHVRRPRAFQENERTMRTSREPRGLQEQAAVCQRDGKIRIRLPLDDDAAIEAVVADRQAFHPYLEIAALVPRIELITVAMRRPNQQLITALTA